MLKQQEPGSGGGWVRTLLVGLVLFAGGVALGKYVLGRSAAGRQGWQTADELHQMYRAPDGFNFVESNKSDEGQLMALLHDPLYQYDPVQNRLLPALAKSHTVSADGKTWTFQLRPAQTPDGTSLSAEDVVFSINLCLDTHYDCKRRGNLVLGGKPIQVKAEGPLTVTFHLPEVYPSFLWALAEFPIVPSAVYKPATESVEAFRRALSVQQPDLKLLAGFGPYHVVALDTQELRLERNEHFWGRGDEQDPKPHLKRIVLALRNPGATTEMDFRNDDRFVYRQVGPGESERLSQDPGFQVLDRGGGSTCTFFWLNQNPRSPWGKETPDRLALFGKVAFRRALARALDRDEIIRRVYKGHAEPIYGPVSPAYRWCADLEILKEQTPAPDLKAALRELAELGVKPGEADEHGQRWLTYLEGGKRRPLTIEIRTAQRPEDLFKKTAEVIAEQLARIGVRVKVIEESYMNVVRRLDNTYDYEASVMSLGGSPNAATMRTFFVSSGEMHFPNPHQKSPTEPWEKEVDRAFKVYSTSSSPETQQQALIEVQKAWVEAQPAFHLLGASPPVAIRRDYEINGLALTPRALDPVLTRTVIEKIRLRRLVAK